MCLSKIQFGIKKTPFFNIRFNPGEPNNTGVPSWAPDVAEGCVEFNNGYNDIDCSVSRAYVCEYKP